MNVVEVINVKKRYGDFNLSLSFNIRKNETIGLVGRNGAGKTTLMEIILNIVKKDEGKVLLFGKDHVQHEATVKEKMGVVLEDHCFYGGMRVNSIIKYCASFYPKWNWEYLKYLQEKLQMDKNKKFQELSMGMKKKLFLMIALSCGAELLLFDEPTANLDPKVRNEILDEIQKVKNEKKPSIIFSSHNMADVEKLSDRIILIENGQIILNEERNRLLSSWKKISFEAKQSVTIESKPNIVRVKKLPNYSYEIIVDDFSESVSKNLEVQLGVDTRISGLSLEEIFLSCVA